MFLSQVSYVEKILKCFEMQQAKGIDTPIVKQNTLVYANKRYQGDNSTITHYQQAVGVLINAMTETPIWYFLYRISRQPICK